MATYRVEEDLLGQMDIPHEAYYGIQTLRAVNNFTISDSNLSNYPNLIIAMAMVKLAAADSNFYLGLLETSKHRAIRHACQRIIEGGFHDQFVVSMLQGGAGTSTNMNANEVIANIALEYLGFSKGDYSYLHPNNDVNMSQSTNDAYPTAIRLGVLLEQVSMTASLSELALAFERKAHEFNQVLKLGRTQLQDAVPMTLGQEFHAFASALKDDVEKISRLLPSLLSQVNLGGTAIGTGINADPGYRERAVQRLSEISGLSFRSAEDLVLATSDMGDFILVSSLLKRSALKISKICNDLRLLSSGPRAGLGEINLPACQPGSSIMPGKVNPVIPEVVNQAMFEIVANDVSVSLAAEAGQLQLNAMEPLIAVKMLDSMRLLQRAADTLRTACIEGITANAEHCAQLLNQSTGLITALNPYIGYQNSSRIAKLALQSGRTVMDLVQAEGLLEPHVLAEVLKPCNMVAPRSL